MADITNDEKIAYLNKVIRDKELTYHGPGSLYKYRPFDSYAFDMLKNDYVYLCPAENEDDVTECYTTVDYNRLLDFEYNQLKTEGVDQIIGLIRPYVSADVYQMIRNKILSVSRKDGTVPAKLMLEISAELEELAPNGLDVAPFVNWIVNIPDMLSEPETNRKIKKSFFTAYHARQETGICSFAETKDNDYMWENYSGNHSGYCIEYDVSEYEFNKGIVPVVYQDERETDIIYLLVATFIGQIIYKSTGGKIKADASQFIRLFTTKNRKWEYQREWRLIGEANARMKAPQISRIYIGKKADKQDIQRMTDYAKGREIELVFAQ